MGSAISLRSASTGGTENALASIDVPNDGDLVGILLSISGDMDADNDAAEMQVSFGSTYSSANDSRQVIASIRLATTLTTSGKSNDAFNVYVPLPDIPVGMGERIFLHSSAIAALAMQYIATLYFSFDEARPSVRRR